METSNNSSDNSLVVKAYLEPHEIRRVSVDASACSSFDYMRQRLHHVFNVPLQEPLSVAWKGECGEASAGRWSDASMVGESRCVERKASGEFV